MNRQTLILGLFLCLCIAQIATPFSMVVTHENILREGVQFKFKTAPVDPYDAFRGRYVSLRIEEDNVPVPAGTRLNYGQKVYAIIYTAPDGFAKIANISLERPKAGSYIEAVSSYASRDIAYLRMPFERYYMEETAAPKAEKAYRFNSTRENRNAYISVRVKFGMAVVEELYIDGVPIKEFLKRQ